MGRWHGLLVTAATKTGLTFSESSATAFLFLEAMGLMACLDAAEARTVCWRVAGMMEMEDGSEED
jgi:hypothetical protein